ncbi:MAG TPA: hypothetical protein VHX14_06025 [Thermoanaerobaculia bacterium]|nr:hypothetical protein [Thermoanaerobaculia bacterium]
MLNFKDPGPKYQEYVKEIRTWLRGVRPFSDWSVAVKPLLGTLSMQCRGEVFYSLHLIADGPKGPQIVFMNGGPPDMYDRRTKTDPAGIREGCIGRTITEGYLLRYFPNVFEVDYYRHANPNTKCELVVLVPSVSAEHPLGVINLESDEENAFDDEDIAAFSLVGVLAGLLATLDERRWAERIVLDGLDGALSELAVHREVVPKQGAILKRALPALRALIPFDAMAIIRADVERDRRLTFDFHSGYDDQRTLEKFQGSAGSFTLDVLRRSGGEAVFENTDTSGDLYHLRRYRDRTRYAIGAVLARTPSWKTALILEFDQPRDHLREQDSVALNQVMQLLQVLANQHEAARTAASYRRAADVLGSLAKRARTSGESVDTLLKRAAPNLASSLHSTLCGFYKVVDDHESGQLLEEIALWREPGMTAANVEWAKRLNDQWSRRIRTDCEQELMSDYAFELTDPKPGEDCRFRFFARTFRPFREGPVVLFVSVKATPDESRWHALRMDEASLQIIDVELALLEAISERLEMSIKNKASQKGLSEVLRLWFSEESERIDPRNPGDLETILFSRAHRFLECWLIETPYSAVFVREGPSLVMHSASVEHLRAHAKDKTVLGQGLTLTLPGESASGATPGITARIFQDGISRVSLRLKRDGGDNCKIFWDKVVGVPSERRFFAGARITDPDSNTSYGVLTVNGEMRPPYSDFPIESQWRFLPVVEALARELGRYLHKIKERPK